MKTLITNLKRTSLKVANRILPVVFFSFFLLACSKEALQPVQQAATTITAATTGTAPIVSDFHLNTSSVVLLEDNAGVSALTLNWTAKNTQYTVYTIEAAVSGTSFANPVELGTTDQNSYGFTVADLNKNMVKLICINNEAKVEIRVKASQDHSTATPVYSQPVALDVTTYATYNNYDNAHLFKIPGNYQSWNLTTAPKIVTDGTSGDYEGFINFTNAYPQFLMIKGSTWDPMITYGYIGASKFGFNGSMMSIFGGSGAYLLRASTNTNTFQYTKINNWSLNGTAVVRTDDVDPVMTKDGNCLVWSVTADFVKGNFRIRANGNNEISFGQKAEDANGTPSYAGANIEIKEAGNYTIRLNLQLAGNYTYSITRNINQ